MILCNGWVQASLDELPDYGLGVLNSVNINAWYKSTNDGNIGLQRYVTYNGNRDKSQAILAAADYTNTNNGFSNIGWGMDYQQLWYLLAAKIEAPDIYWRTTPQQLSYVDFAYSYANMPAVKNSSNENIIVLSATADNLNSDNYSVVLENPTAVTSGTNLVFDIGGRLIDSQTTRIDSSGGSGLINLSVNSNSTRTINFTPSDVVFSIVPSAGYVDVTLDTWQTAGAYYKKWTETGSTSDISASHTVGDLKADTEYTVFVDGAYFGAFQSDSSGKISFTYHGGYSTKTFEVMQLIPSEQQILPDTGCQACN